MNGIPSIQFLIINRFAVISNYRYISLVGQYNKIIVKIGKEFLIYKYLCCCFSKIPQVKSTICSWLKRIKEKLSFVPNRETF